MKINIRATQLEITDALKEYIDKKIISLDKVLSFLKDEEVLMKIEVARLTKHHQKGDVYYVELNLDIPGKKIRIEQQSDDVRRAVDLAKDRIKYEIEEYKDKLIKKNR